MYAAAMRCGCGGASALRRLLSTRAAAVVAAAALRACSSSSNNSSSKDDVSEDDKSKDNANSATRVHRKVQIAVIGSGPSGCYMAAQLTRKRADVHVDVYERLPVAFGLSRYGVAPDHADVKAVEEQWLQLYKSGRVTWLGNLAIGRDMDVHTLLQHYAAVVFATGASQPRSLTLPGASSLAGVVSAKAFVDYYNTMPFPHGAPRFCPVELARCKRALVLGNGNVALDVARVLSASTTHFATTDMNAAALRELARHNRVAHVDIVARRGVADSAFTAAELRELSRVEASRVHVAADAFDLDAAIAQCTDDNNNNNKDDDTTGDGMTSHMRQEQQQQEHDKDMQARRLARNPRAHRRLMELTHTFCVSDARMRDEWRRYAANEHGELLHGDDGDAARVTGVADGGNTNTSLTSINDNNDSNHDNKSSAVTRPATATSRHTRGPCEVRLRYHLRPLRVLPSATRRNCVGAVLFERTDASTAAAAAAPAARQYCLLPCDVVFTSVGFCVDEAAMRAAGVPVDHGTGGIANDGGRVRGMPRVYCVGWARHGARGSIAHALADAQEMSDVVLHDVLAHRTHIVADTSNSKDGVVATAAAAADVASTATMTHEQLGKFGLLDELVRRQLEPVSVMGLQRILHAERERGIDLGKHAEKLDRVRDMLDVAAGGNTGQQTSDRVRGIAPQRPPALQKLADLLDEETDMRPLMRELLRTLPPEALAYMPQRDSSTKEAQEVTSKGNDGSSNSSSSNGAGDDTTTTTTTSSSQQ